MPRPELPAEIAEPIDRLAAELDELEFARLADELGTYALLRALADPSRRATVLRAVPLSSDSELAIAPLAEYVASTAEDEELVLMAIARIAQRSRFDEPLDPDGIRAGYRSLLQLAHNPTRSETARALAETALARITECYRGRVELPPTTR